MTAWSSSAAGSPGSRQRQRCAQAVTTGEIVLIDRAEFPYDRPPLSKDYLAGSRDLEQIALQPPEWYAEQRVELFGPAEVACHRLPATTTSRSR